MAPFFLAGESGKSGAPGRQSRGGPDGLLYTPYFIG
jgi:hypothetical protein